MTNTPRVAVEPLPYVDPSPERRGPWSFQEHVDPDHTALLLVDLQNDFLHPDGAWAKQRQDPFAPEALRNLQALLPAVRRSGVPVLHVRTVFNNWTVSSVVADRWRTLGIGPLCWEGSWGAGSYDIQPQEGDRIVNKFRASGFVETDLELTLRAKEIETILIGGMGVWGGVYETAWDGVARDHTVVLIEDCVAGGRSHDRDVLTELFLRYAGHCVSSGTIVRAWS